MKKIAPILFLVLMFSCDPTTKSLPDSESIVSQVAITPPMGWNSFDAYDCRINEEDFKATVDVMAEKLLPFGWEYAVIDYIWWHPEPGNWATPRRFGHPNLRYNADGSPLHPEYVTMDEYGRLLPSVERFPSAADGKGFKPIADYVHSKGLKFGIHIMRGIHRKAWSDGSPIMGTELTAKDIAETQDTCTWCNHMFGVDHTKPGAQEYYNSIFELYAEWGVDFIKADDITVPPYHKGEIEMIHNAIENCGRPIVLSLSPGESPLSRANHLKEYSNMWRISADFWDNWPELHHSFDLLNQWAPHIGPGHWPDADMLPIGKIALNNRPRGTERYTLFTWNEQITLMTLFSIARSPLMLGADLLSLKDSTLFLLTNDEVLYVNQHSTNNRQIIKRNYRNKKTGEMIEYAIWAADDPESDDKFIALFNLSDTKKEVCFNMEWEYFRGEWKVRDLWEKKDIGKAEGDLCAEIGPHGSVLYRLSK